VATRRVPGTAIPLAHILRVPFDLHVRELGVLVASANVKSHIVPREPEALVHGSDLLPGLRVEDPDQWRDLLAQLPEVAVGEFCLPARRGWQPDRIVEHEVAYAGSCRAPQPETRSHPAERKTSLERKLTSVQPIDEGSVHLPTERREEIAPTATRSEADGTVDPSETESDPSLQAVRQGFRETQKGCGEASSRTVAELVGQRDLRESHCFQQAFASQWSLLSVPLRGLAHAPSSRYSTVRRLRKIVPITSRSILVRRKQSRASAGVLTIGSFSLNEVLRTIGTPVSRAKAAIRRQ